VPQTAKEWVLGMKDFNQHRRLSVPGKVFLLGEYAVLHGFPGLLLSTRPRFVMEYQGGEVDTAFAQEFRSSLSMDSVHPDSPAGKLLVSVRRGRDRASSIRFFDPYGYGGFGASCAQYLLLRVLLEGGRLPSRELWTTYLGDYLTLFSEASRPSGLDLVSQFVGGRVWIDARAGSLKDLNPEFPWQNLLVFSATELPGRKVATHDHLTSIQLLPPSLLSKLGELVHGAASSIESVQPAALGKAMTEYASLLAQLGFESEAAREDRLAFSELRGVLGSKGCGAGLSDVIIVLAENIERDGGAICSLAEQRGLKLVQAGVDVEPGLKIEEMKLGRKESASVQSTRQSPL